MRASHALSIVGSLVVAGALLSGCGLGVPSADAPAPDPVYFANNVYPVLMRDCSFTECHGSTERFFQVYGPNRRRLDPDATCGVGRDTCSDPATVDEINRSYDRARSMLAGASRAEDTLLLRKPLEVDSGGAPHLGTDAYGRDVYANPGVPEYQFLRTWAAPVFEGSP
jgi:hypothetical protein